MEIYNACEMTRLASAFTAALGVLPPKSAQPAADELKLMLSCAFGGAPAQKAVIYNPDAVAQWLYQKYTLDFAEVIRYTRLALPVRAVMPSVTPVCFATMYTGSEPRVHGIREYKKNVLRADTVFDALLRAGKKCAIVSDADSSMSRIFLERNMDYFTDCKNGEESVKLGVSLIEADRYDFIAVYNSAYDETIHSSRTEAPEALDAFRASCRFFGCLARAVRRAYASYDTFIGFAPDHGCHDSPDTGRGTHGSSLPEDLNVMHFYGAIRASAESG